MVSLRGSAVIMATSLLVAGACGSSEPPSVDAGGKDPGSPTVPLLDERNPADLPRAGGPPSIVAFEGGIFTVDDAVQTEITLYDVSGEDPRVITPRRRISRPDAGWDGERLVVLGEDCERFEVLAGAETRCDPGGYVLMAYEPDAGHWSLLAEGIGTDEEQLTVDLVRPAAPLVIHLRSTRGNRLVAVDPEDGRVDALSPPPAAGFTEDDPEMAYAACEVDGSVAVLSGSAQLPRSRPVQVDILDEEARTWSSWATELEGDVTSLGVPLCTGQGIALLSPDHTLSFHDKAFTSSRSVPEGGLGLTITMPTERGLGCWSSDRLWLLPHGEADWVDTGVKADHVLAGASLGDHIAVLRESRDGPSAELTVVEGPR